VPLVIPCHRVVRKDGSPGGYRLGPARKRRLLALERRVAVVLCADVVGWSGHVARDAESTVHALRAARERFALAVEWHGGRVVDLAGDSLLAEFPSAPEAVGCALEVQRLGARRNARLPSARRLELRIGLHAGELLVEGGRVYGNAVNVAARLERLASPGGLCLSDEVRAQLPPALASACEDLGRRSLRNIPEPVRCYGLVG
jgi:class 3 adenylate cyclase